MALFNDKYGPFDIIQKDNMRPLTASILSFVRDG